MEALKDFKINRTYNEGKQRIVDVYDIKKGDNIKHLNIKKVYLPILVKNGVITKNKEV